MSQTPIPLGLVETALTSPHAAALMGRHTGTHEFACRLVAQMVRFTEDVDLITDVFRACVAPDYGGNTLSEIPGMVRGALEKGFAERAQNETAGRNGPTEKASSVALKLMRTVRLFHTTQGDAYVSLRFPRGGRYCVPVRSDAFKRRVQLTYYEASGKALPKEGLSEVVDLVEAIALGESPLGEVHVRVAQQGEEIFYDLGDEDGTIVAIDAHGWRLQPDSPMDFARPPGIQAQVAPRKGGRVSDLGGILSIDPDNLIILEAFAICALNPIGPYPLLFIGGDHGSGKSHLSSLVKRIIDPNALEKLRLPGDEHTLAIQASQNRLLVYDNTSYVRAEISDALCALVTGGGFATRKYYTDNETRMFKNARPVVINGIGEFADRPDLLDRAMQVKLTNIAASNRPLRTERELNRAFEDILPGVLGHLFEITGYALANLAKVDPPTELRMADAAHWLVAAEPATGHPPGTFVGALKAGLEGMLVTKALNDPLVLALRKVLLNNKYSRSGFEGGFGELHDELKGEFGQIDRRLPATPAHLSNAIQRLKPAMETIGLIVEMPRRDNRGQRVRLWLVPSENRPEIEIGGEF